MKMLEERILSCLKAWMPRHPGQSPSWLLGVSGGADSLSMMLLLADIADVLPMRLGVIHVHHGLRGKDADDDAKFVRVTCENMDIPCYVVHVNTLKKCSETGWSVEMAARSLRHGAYRKIMKDHGYDAVLLAHTADDQDETMLLRLFNGGSVRSLAGMKDEEQIQDLHILRPLLNERRETLVDYLDDLHVSWCEDVSNHSIDIARNALRHEILPLIRRRINPAASSAMERLRKQLTGEASFWEEQIEHVWSQCMQDDGIGTTQWAGQDLSRYHVALQRRVIHRWLETSMGHQNRFDFKDVERIRAAMSKQDGCMEIHLSGTALVAQEYGVFRVKASASHPYYLSLRPQGETVFSDIGITVRISDAAPPSTFPKDSIGRLPITGYLSADLAGAPLSIRNVRLGDRMRPAGLNGSKKVQDIFTDAKVPVSVRAWWPFFVVDDEIVWIPGYRTSRDAAVPPHATTCRCITITPYRAD